MSGRHRRTEARKLRALEELVELGHEGRCRTDCGWPRWSDLEAGEFHRCLYERTLAAADRGDAARPAAPFPFEPREDAWHRFVVVRLEGTPDRERILGPEVAEVRDEPVRAEDVSPCMETLVVDHDEPVGDRRHAFGEPVVRRSRPFDRLDMRQIRQSEQECPVDVEATL